MNKIFLQKTVASFGVEACNISRPKHAALTEAYVVDDAYILRARKLGFDTILHLEEEQKLLRDVVSLTGLQLPILLPTTKGFLYVEDKDRIWTLYPIISGEVKYTWYHLDQVDDATVAKTFKALRVIHEKTRGKLEPLKIYNGFAKDVEERLSVVKHEISDSEKKRVTDALRNVFAIEKNLKNGEMVYVHGDYHPGNIISDGEGKIAGLVDTDWGRVGCFLEDLAYTVMMFLRDYRDSLYTFDEKKLKKLLSHYGLS